MNIQQLKRNIEALIPQYEDEDVPQLQKLIIDLDHTEALSALGGHFAIKDYCQLLIERIAGINKMLCEKRKMTELERENLLDRKELYQEFVDMFDLDKKVAAVEEYIKTL